jgi:signal transduction histidine kinase
MLAALPVQLIPGDVSVSLAEETTPIRISLWIAWLCVLLAATAVGVLLRGVVQLSERRGAFVSAVTHELRTPLTTLRMYAEMLAKQMVPSEQKRAQYLDTMRAEADRLAHLVENVLSFSRLERHRAGGQAVNISLAELLAKIQPRLSQRAEQAGMSIVMPSENGKVSVRADVVAVEQILFNLVDNACKYAATASDRTIHIQCEQRDSQAAVQVSDHGPGIDALEARRLFKPFSKSAHDAANTAPGVGLGLALSRRLARNMGGDLRLANHSQTGACFQLTLPCA